MAATDRPQTPCAFDRIEFVEDGKTHECSCEEFRAMPLPLRIRRVLQGNPRFYRQGRLITRAEALTLGSD